MERKDIGVHIVAGFLGAGKTTFINKLFEDGIDASSTVLIENELGDVAIDDELLQAGDLTVRTLTSGCVCCSLRGDLADTIEMVVEKLAPKTILIEPTGVASPNELIRICANDLWNLPLRVESVVTIVNAQSVEELLDLDIGVFDAQLDQARLVVLSRTQFMDPSQIASACDIIREQVGWQVPILDAPWSGLDALEVLGIAQEAFAAAASPAVRDDADARGGGCGCEHEHGHDHDHDCGRDHDHDHDHEHGHDHDHAGHLHQAGGIESCVVHPEAVFDQAFLHKLADSLESDGFGQVLRAKGFVRGTDGGMLHIEYVYGSMSVAPIDYAGEPKLVVIGRNLALPSEL